MSSANRDSFISFFSDQYAFIPPCSSYLPVYAEVQKPHVYLKSSQVEVSNLYLGVPRKANITLINGTLLPTQFQWGEVSVLTLSAPGLQPLSTRGPCGGRHCPRVPPLPPEQMLSCLPHSLPLAHSAQKAGLFERAAHLVWLFLA